MQIRESAEDYLESIYVFEQQHGYARSIDIANDRNVTKASVSVAMKQLRENGYINMGADNAITLTPAGREIAERVYNRHTLLTSLLVSLGVSQETAEKDACKIEHDLSEETLEALRRHLRTVKA